MLVMESLPFIRAQHALIEGDSPWRSLHGLRREVSWQERMLKVGASQVDRDRAAESLAVLRPRLLAAGNDVRDVNHKLLGWGAVGLACCFSLWMSWSPIAALFAR